MRWGGPAHGKVTKHMCHPGHRPQKNIQSESHGLPQRKGT